MEEQKVKNKLVKEIGMEEDRRHKEEGKGDHASKAAIDGAVEIEGAALEREGAWGAHAYGEKQQHEEPDEGDSAVKQGVASEEAFWGRRESQTREERAIGDPSYAETVGAAEECKSKAND